MPKTIAITPSWYWPQGVPRAIGIPPYSLVELCIERPARRTPGGLALAGADRRLTYAELLAAVEEASKGVQAGGEVEVADDGSAEAVVRLFGAWKGGAQVRVSGTPAAPGVPAGSDLRNPVMTLPGTRGPVRHSHRSILAGALSLVTFLEAREGRHWFSPLPFSRWDGLLAVVAPLLRGAAAVRPAPGADADDQVTAFVRDGAGYAWADLDVAARWTRDAKRATKDARRVLDAFLLSVSGMFNPDDRRRVSRAFECPALTVFGTPEAGPIFGSHASWYLDESVGLPITNMHVVPSDPRTGVPIQALWELVESAEVTVFSPALFCADESHAGRFVDHRYRTGVIASSDANGMIYLLE